jgi:hypothetical protein
MTVRSQREIEQPQLRAVYYGENASCTAALRVCPYVEPTEIAVVVDATIGVRAL